MMNTRTPQPSAAAKILRSFFASQGISVRHTQALEAVARMKGYPNTHAMTADTPDDTELTAFLENAQKEALKDGQKPELTLAGEAKALRAMLSRISGFLADNYPRIDFEKVVALLPSDLPRNERDYVGFTLAVCLEDDAGTGRVAPYATYVKRRGAAGEGWTNSPIPKDDEAVLDLSVKVLVRALKTEGLNLTGIYDESPKRES